MLLTADRIHDGQRFLPQGSVLEADDSGTIIVVHSGDAGGDVQRYSGTLCPGFVNAHCHLELSHLEGIIPQRTGLISFLQTVVRNRADFSDEQRKAARHGAYDALLQAGTVAVGDIANTPDTLDLRTRDGLSIHTFVECIGFDERGAERRFAAAEEVYGAFSRQARAPGSLFTQSIVPHAPYSVSERLFRMIDAHAPAAPLSIHNEESSAEDQWFRHGSGPVRDLLEGLGIPLEGFAPSGQASLPTYGRWLSPSRPLLLVHNTATAAGSVRWATARFPQLWWVLCPGANLYIEGRLPDVPMLLREGARLCLGTDSLASNTGLSILAEMQILRQRFPELAWEGLLGWATLAGARALGMEELLGSFKPGKKPGILLLAPDYEGVQRLL